MGQSDIYPNPVSDVLKISAPSAIDAIYIYNTLGQQLQAQNPQAAQTEVDFSALPRGTYLLKAFSGDQTLMRKIIKK